MIDDDDDDGSSKSSAFVIDEERNKSSRDMMVLELSFIFFCSTRDWEGEVRDFLLSFVSDMSQIVSRARVYIYIYIYICVCMWQMLTSTCADC